MRSRQQDHRGDNGQKSLVPHLMTARGQQRAEQSGSAPAASSAAGQSKSEHSRRHCETQASRSDWTASTRRSALACSIGERPRGCSTSSTPLALTKTQDGTALRTAPIADARFSSGSSISASSANGAISSSPSAKLACRFTHSSMTPTSHSGGACSSRPIICTVQNASNGQVRTIGRASRNGTIVTVMAIERAATIGFTTAEFQPQDQHQRHSGASRARQCRPIWRAVVAASRLRTAIRRDPRPACPGMRRDP